MTIEAINEREKQLLTELESIRKVKALVADNTILDLLRQVLSNGQVLNLQQEPTKVRTYKQGARKEVLLALLTGPATQAAIAAAMKWTAVKTNGVVQPMERHHLVIFTNGKYALTGQGKAQATWYQTHPQHTTYRRNIA